MQVQGQPCAGRVLPVPRCRHDRRRPTPARPGAVAGGERLGPPRHVGAGRGRVADQPAQRTAGARLHPRRCLRAAPAAGPPRRRAVPRRRGGPRRDVLGPTGRSRRRPRRDLGGVGRVARGLAGRAEHRPGHPGGDLLPRRSAALAAVATGRRARPRAGPGVLAAVPPLAGGVRLRGSDPVPPVLRVGAGRDRDAVVGPGASGVRPVPAAVARRDLAAVARRERVGTTPARVAAPRGSAGRGRPGCRPGRVALADTRTARRDAGAGRGRAGGRARAARRGLRRPHLDVARRSERRPPRRPRSRDRRGARRTGDAVAGLGRGAAPGRGLAAGAGRPGPAARRPRSARCCRVGWTSTARSSVR